jgi:hypothetical protein
MQTAAIVAGEEVDGRAVELHRGIGEPVHPGHLALLEGTEKKREEDVSPSLARWRTAESISSIHFPLRLQERKVIGLIRDGMEMEIGGRVDES